MPGSSLAVYDTSVHFTPTLCSMAPQPSPVFCTGTNSSALSRGSVKGFKQGRDVLGRCLQIALSSATEELNLEYLTHLRPAWLCLAGHAPSLRSLPHLPRRTSYS